MTSLIQPLSTDIVHLIAAGEVIDSLAAVVRELAENAIDAGATRISVLVCPSQWRVRVADNGVGMSRMDLENAANPHSTSKIRCKDDLLNVSSLGFRGEALHSLAQLADLEICSRPGTAADGWHVQYDRNGEPIATNAVAIAPGTIVTVDNLFHSWAARRQGLPSLSLQLRAIQTTLYHLALCHPQITWQVEQSDRSWFAIWSGATVQAILPQLLKDVQPSDLKWVNLRKEDALASQSLELLLGLPDRCHRHRPDWIKVAVNGRVVNAPELEQTLLSTLKRTLPRDRFPIGFVHLHAAPDQVDWNRHPAKAELYLRELDAWRDCVTEAIAQALQMSPALREDAASRRVGQILKAAEAEGVYGTSRSIEPDAESPPSADLRAVGQVHQMYILAEHSSGVWLIEQHIAHERVLFEQLCDRWQFVSLEPPVILNQLTDTQVEQLQRIGAEVEPFGDRLWAVRTAPEPLAARADCAEALIELSLCGDLQTAIVATACRTAIRNRSPLNLSEMQTLLEQWQRTRHPRTCPHGRPICLSLEESSLSKFFRRHWVIGKSHGI